MKSIFTPPVFENKWKIGYIKHFAVLLILFVAIPHYAFTQSCLPISQLPCEQVQVALPYSLSFSGAVSGTVPDRNGAGTGFTMVDAYSGARLAEDGMPSNSSLPGYEASKLTLASGRLQLVTNKGIAWLGSNNQLNALGVRVDSRASLQAQVTLVNPYYGTASQQAGLWFGLNDRTYVKLVVVGNKVELRREVNDVSGSADQRMTPSISGINTSSVRLRLQVDPAAGTVQGFYSLNGGAEQSVGTALSISGTGLTGPTALAGVFATHRNGSSPVTYTFDDFSVQNIGSTPSGCPPISQLPCEQVQVALPYSLSFSGAVSGTVPDRNGAGTGFTMVDAYSGARLAEDGMPSNSSLPGYEASKLTLASGRLQLVTNKGIAWLGSNNQLNALGVRVDSRASLQAQVTLVNPYYGTASQQAGLWFGLNDRTYVKLVVVGNKVELRREVNDVSGSADQRMTPSISGINTSSVRLRLQVDPAAGTVQGFYSLNGGAEQSVGTALSISGTGLTGPTALAGVFATHRNGSSPVTYTFDDFSVAVLSSSDSLRPYVTAVRPQNGATDVSLDQSISVDLSFPSGKSLDGGTVNPSTVKLYTVINGVKSQVSGTAVNATAAGDAITLTATLKTSTNYEFEITEQVKDLNGYSIVPFRSTFKTTSSSATTPPDLVGVSFTEKVLIDNSFGSDGFTSLVIGPDHRLYATTSGGKIERWDINADGTLANYRSISPFGSNRRLLIGIRFAQDASSNNLIAWISHSSPEFENVPDWTSKISKINLNNPATPVIKDYVINLPRSIKDHSINSIDIGPDGALYVVIGSNTAMGAPDPAWGNRPERLLSAAVLRLDIAKADQQSLPIDARTKEGGGSYNPYSTNAPLTLYATGLRNAYDLVWHTNGQLYVPTNGSAAGGNTPALKSGSIWSNGSTYTGPDIPAMTDVRDTQSDYLFRVLKGGYYGHPNALRNEYILNGGNPTSKEDPGEVVWTVNGINYGYPVGTPTEPKYKGWSYDFSTNKSPNGVIEYKSNAFDGKLTGKLLVCRFSGGDDIMILEPGGTNKDIVRAVEGSLIPGLRRPFSNPLDVIEDIRTGNLYISEYFDGNGNGQPRITLLKADKPASTPTVNSGLINSGGSQYTDSQSRTWGADAGFSGGVTGAKSFDVAGTTDDGLYLSYRYAAKGAPFGYSIPVSGAGPHTVRLHFLEPYFGAPGGKTSALAGARVFHVDIEGTRVLSNYDIYSQDGAGRAIVKTFQNVAVSDGALTVSFTSVADNAIISAIEVISASGTIAIKSNLETQEAEQNKYKKESTLHIYPNPNHGGNLNFDIQGFGELETVELTLFDMAGRPLYKDLAKTDAVGFTTGKIIIKADLSPGMYLFKAQSKSFSRTTKFIKH